MTNESSVTRDFKHWLEKNKPNNTVCYEFKIIKLDKKKSFAFSQVAEHQVEYLMTSLEGFWYKISDGAAINGFSSPKPFDSIWIKASNSYIVPIFYEPRKVKTAFLIPIWEFIKLRAEWKRKSIHMDELTFEKIEL
jgi:hypothetical protein